MLEVRGETDLLKVIRGQQHAGQLFPDDGSQVKVEGFLGADGHAQEDPQEAVEFQAAGVREERVQKETVAVEAHFIGSVGGWDQQWHNTSVQLLS